MLKFAAVGSHGREYGARIALCAILTTTWVATVVPQSSTGFEDLLPELAAKIAGVVAPVLQLSLTTPASDTPADDMERLQTTVSNLLSSRGLRVVAAGEGVASVRLGCRENLRERSCVAQISRGGVAEVVLVTGPRSGTSPADRRSQQTLELRSLFTQRTRILDVASLTDRLLVLDPTSLTLYQQQGSGWQPVRSVPVSSSRAWPRDLRGRVRVEGDLVEVFLPGVTCGGTLNPLTLSCTERQRPWPIGIENAGLDAVRNYFATPEGLELYGAAPLGADAEARWLVADRNGALSLLDGSRQLIARVAAGDEVVALATPCGPETFVVVGARAGDRDALRLFHVARRRLMSVSSLIPLPGTLTALWAVPGSIAATVVAHDAAGGRYEAFRASITCSR